MVQLKVIPEPVMSFREREFQFLMVQLKVASCLQRQSSLSFQFLMVQLKALKGYIQSLSHCISIPYGAIKSPSFPF